MPHALLLAGPQGVGKLAFAQALAARLLCEQRTEGGAEDRMACGECNSCRWLAADSHPDFRLVQPDDGDEGSGEGEEGVPAVPATGRKGGRGPIRVDQIRGLSDFVYLGSHRHGNRVVVVAPAESMNLAAANSLLKILEEPPAGVYFIMVSSSWRRVIPTLRSRCRTVTFGRPDFALGSQWLAANGVDNPAELLGLVGGAPLLAAEWGERGRLDSHHEVVGVLAEEATDPVAMAAKWGAVIKSENAYGLPQLIDTVQKWVIDIVLVKVAGVVRYHVSWRKRLDALALRASTVGLIGCHLDLLRIRAVAEHPLNSQLFLEDLATRYLRSVSGARGT